MDEESVVLEVKIDDQSQDRSPLVSPTGRILPDPAERAPKPGSRGASGETVEDDLKRARESLRRAQATVARRKRELQNVLKVTDSAGESEDILTNAVRQARASFARNARFAGIARAFGRGAMTAAAQTGGPPFLAMAAALAAATASLWAFREGLQVAKSAMEFSPRLAAAGQLAQREELFGRMRQAGELEGELTQLLLVNTELKEELREFKTEALKLLLPVATAAAQVSAEVVGDLGVILRLVNAVSSPAEIIKQLIVTAINTAGIPAGMGEAAIAALSKVADYIDAQNEADMQRRVDEINAELEEFLDPDVFLEQMSHQRSRMPQRQPRGRYRTR